MMRTIQEIKSTITNAILANTTLCSAFSLREDASWESQVSQASILDIIIYIVAVSQYTTEWMMQQFITEVETRIKAAYPGSISWLWNKAMEYQDNTSANAFFYQHGVYDNVVTEDRIIHYCAIVEEYNFVKIKVSKTDYLPLSATQLEQFTAYMERLKFAGVHLSVSSTTSDDLDLTVKIWRNKLLLTTEDDTLIQAAVEEYLNNIKYDGIFNKTLLIDALQKVSGVLDATIEDCIFTAHDSASTITDLQSQNYKSVAGHINLNSLVVRYE